MEISISYGSNTLFSPKAVNNIKDVAEAALDYSISTGIFRNNYRNLDNFKYADFIALDVDEGMSIDEAKLKFNDYVYAILPSRNHQKEKNGKICDRFRVILQLAERITNQDDFYETWFSLQNEFGDIDPSAKDPSRQFFACKSISSIKGDGKLVPVKRWVPKEKTKSLEKFDGIKGELGKATLKFLFQGAPVGSRNNELYKAARDMHQNGYEKHEVVAAVSDIEHILNMDVEELMNTIDSAFSKDPKHEPRIEENPFAPITVDQLYKKKDVKIDWLVNDFLALGSCSIIAGPPKAGKSTLIRQLSACIAMGEKKFLNRSVKPGKVLYLALEEQLEVLKIEYRKIGLKGDNFHVVVGGINKEAALDNIKKYVNEHNIKFVVIDTLMVFSNVDDVNSYKEVYQAMTDLRNLARETSAHVMVVHHTNKSEFQGANSIMGSQAFLGGGDIAIIFKALGHRRYIETLQRVGNAFTGQELHFDSKTNTYSIGKKKESDESDPPF